MFSESTQNESSNELGNHFQIEDPKNKICFKSNSVNYDTDINNLLNINICNATLMSFVKSDAHRSLIMDQLKFELQIPTIVQKSYISDFVKSNLRQIALLPDLMPLLTT